MLTRTLPYFLAALAVSTSASLLRAADWPMGRYDAQRSAASPQELPAQLHLHWVREYPPQVPAWPARGAPVLVPNSPSREMSAAIPAGTIYFAASIWPFMGIFIHAVDARTGQAIWTNDGDGSLYMKQPHNTEDFASIAPQGPLV